MHVAAFGTPSDDAGPRISPGLKSKLFILMLFPIPKKRAVAAMITVIISVAGCAVTLPPPPLSNPADPNALAAASAPPHPRLLATSRNYLSPHADDREEKAKKMEMTESQTMTKGATYFTCPMHPEIHEAKPGECPKCGMMLVKKNEAEKQ